MYKSYRMYILLSNTVKKKDFNTIYKKIDFGHKKYYFFSIFGQQEHIFFYKSKAHFVALTIFFQP